MNEATKNALNHLARFVCGVESLVRTLCEKAPSVARYLAREILKHVELDKGDDGGQDAEEEPNIEQKPCRRRKRPEDPSYQPPRTRTKPISTVIESSDENASASSESVDRKDSTVIQTGYGEADGIASGVPPEKTQGQVVAQSRCMNGDTTPRFSILTEAANGACSGGEEGTATCPLRPSSTPVQVARGRSPLTDEATDVEDKAGHDSSSPRLPSTPPQVTGERSPATEDVPRTNIPVLPDTIPSPGTPSRNPFKPSITLQDMVTEAIDTIAKMARDQKVPKEARVSVLSALRISFDGISSVKDLAERSGSMWTATDPNLWSASMWIHILEARESSTKKRTIFTMIEYMGASAWFDAQLTQVASKPPLTKRGKPRVRVSSVVLDRLLKDAQPASQANSLSPDDLEAGVLPGSLTGVQKRVQDERRQKISKSVHRGHKLRSIVAKTGLGILFLPKIWDYTKMRDEDFERDVARKFQENQTAMSLLTVLGEQVLLVVEEGRPNLSRFLDSLVSHSVVKEEETLGLRARLGPEDGAAPAGSLEDAAHQLTSEVGQALSKRTFDDDDFVMVNYAVQLPCASFDRLRAHQWFDIWTIAAAMEITDKPAYVRWCYSIPLDETRNGTITPIVRPLARWRKEIDKYRSEDQSDSKTRLIFFCPLNVSTNHFTLLEINEQLRMIYHYDSMASHNVIRGRTRSTRVREVVEEEFGYLKFGYAEQPCPQQKDGSSCGPMVVRNAKRRMNGLPAGDWDDFVDASRLRTEIVDGFCDAVRSGALRAVRSSKRRRH